MNKKTVLEAISIGLVGFISPAAMAIVSGLAYFQQYYSSIDRIWIQMLLIGPTVTSIPACLIAGRLCKRFGHKKIIILGEILTLIGGMTPLLTINFPIIVTSRLIMGIGSGLSGTAVSGLVFCAYSDKKTTANTEIVLQAAGCVGASIFTIVGGWLSDIQWNYCFLAYLLIIPAIIMSVLFTPKEIIAQDSSDTHFLIPIKPVAWGMILILGATSGFMALYSNNISGFVIHNGLGSALTAGIAAGIVDITGFIGCLTGYAIYVKTDRWLIAACAFMCGIIYFILSGAQSMSIVYIMALLFGYVQSVKAPITSIIIREIQPPETMTSVCGIITLFDSLFRVVIVLGFTKCFSKITTGNERLQYFAGAVGLMAVAVITLIFTLKNRRPKTEGA